MDEFDVGVVSDGNNTANTVVENAAVGTLVGITAQASDADATTNTITYSLDNSAGGRFAIDSVIGVVTVAGAIDRETAASYDITVKATSADGSSSTQTFSIAISDVDEFNVGTVSDSDNATNSATENAAVGSLVGITAQASDADATTNVITYSLDNSAGGRFAIDSVSGVVTVAGAIDREAAGSYGITVKATSADGSSSTQTFSITISDVDEFDVGLIVDNDATTNTVAENSAIGTLVGITAQASDADATTNTITYSLDNSADGRFNIDSVSGVVTVAGAIDRETAGSYDITVKATSSDGSSSTQTFSITIGDVDEFDVGTVSDSDNVANSVDENAAAGTLVGVTAQASDADATTNTITYSLDNSADGRFAIDSVSGVVTVAKAIDREAAASYDITVRATSADGSSSTQTFSITISDVDEFNVGTVSDSDNATNTVAENAAVGTLVGIAAQASDVDATTNTITYSLDNSADGRFAIDSASGVVTVAGAIDREAAASYGITVKAISSDGSSSTQTFSITIGDVDESGVGTVSDIDNATNTVAENAAVGTLVGITAQASDADATTNTITYSLDNSADGRFAIDSVSGVVSVAGAIDREVAGSYDIVVKATSADGSSSTQTFSITIGDVDEFNVGAVSDSDNATNTVAENAAVGTLVGITAQASDVDATTNTITYSLDNSADGRFAIDSASGVVTVAGAIDREAAASYGITVKAISSDDSSSTQTFSITIGDVDEFDVGTVSDSDNATNTVAENAAVGTLVGITAQASDADATTNTIAYSLDNSGDGRFAIDPVSGVVTVAGAIDRETAESYDITVKATSADGSSSTQTFSIAISDVDEFDVGAISDVNNVANSVVENAAVGTLVGITAQASDADATTNTITYSFDNSADGRFAIDSVSGVVTVAGAIDRETAASYDITVKATSADGSSSTQTFSIAISDVDEFDVGAVSDSNNATDTVAENVAIGTLVGITAQASDADATTNAIAYSLDDNADGRFAIDPVSGVVTVAGTLDYESVSSYIINVRALGSDSSFSTKFFSIIVGDVEENVLLNGTSGNDVFLMTITSQSIQVQINHESVNGYPLDSIFAIDGSSGADQLRIVGSTQQTIWTTTAANSSTAKILGRNYSQFTLTSIESLRGSDTSPDSFTVTSAGLLTGNINGGSGPGDSLTTLSGSGSINWAAGSASGVLGGFTDIDIVGGTGGAFTGPNAEATWTLTGPGSGTVAYGNNQSIGFTGYNSLIGGSANDTFLMGTSGLFTGINGGGGTDTLNLSDLPNPTINLVNRTGTSSGLVEQLESLIGSGTTSTLIGPNLANTWTVSGVNSGSLANSTGTTTFSGFGRVTGGTSTDGFSFSEAGSITGQLSGGSGTNTLSFAGRTTPVRVQGSGSSSSSGSVRLQSNSAQSIVASYSQITTHVGSPATDEFVGANAVSNWTIHATGGTIGTSSFSSYEQLFSGAADDTFTIQALGTVSGINGGGGLDTLIAPNTDNTWTVTGSGTGTLNTLAYSQMENLTGGTGDDLFLMQSGGSVTGRINPGTGINTLSYANRLSSVHVNLSASTPSATNVSRLNDGFSILIGGSGNDTLIGSASRSMVIVGGAGNDTITGGSGRDILIGGLGSDTLRGGSGEDVVIGGEIASQNNLQTLKSLQLAWLLPDGQASRRAQLKLIDQALLAETSEDAGAVDKLFGDEGEDWLVGSLEDEFNEGIPPLII